MAIISNIRIEHETVRGWRSEFRCWWKMAKNVEVVFDKSRNPGSISICRDCCQILSLRSCSGTTSLSAKGCDYHRLHPAVPFAIKSTIISSRLRDLVRPDMSIFYYYIQPGKTDLMNVSWVKVIREANEETRRERTVYEHSETCFHGEDPKSIMQGKGVRGIYWKRCDGRYVNALAEELDYCRPPERQKRIEYDLATDVEVVAEQAWRLRNEEDVPQRKEEKKQRRRRKWQCMVM